MIKLDIGSGGPSADDSFISIDPYVPTADIQAFMWDLPFEDESVDVIFASQSLEHISKYNVVPTLREWKRVLKPGGRLQILVPDLEWVLKWWLDHPDVTRTDYAMDWLFGHQSHEGEIHRTGFTPDIFKMYFSVVGGFKIHKIDRFGGYLPEKGTVSQMSLNLEAEKE